MKLENLPTTADAYIWSEEFVKLIQSNPAIASDKEVMQSWFANAIMSGYDLARKEQIQQEVITQSVDKILKIEAKIEAILLGINIIRKYEIKASIEAEHEIIFVGNYEQTYSHMSEEERLAMNRWGWFEKYEAWAINV